MFVRGTKLVFDTARKAVTRRLGPKKSEFISYREFYHLNEIVHISGALKWIGNKIYITESVAAHATNRFNKIYYIHYEDGIVIRHHCDPRISRHVVRAIDVGHNNHSSRYLRWLQQKARKYFMQNREAILDDIASGNVPPHIGDLSEIYATVSFGKDITVAAPGMWFFMNTPVSKSTKE